MIIVEISRFNLRVWCVGSEYKRGEIERGSKGGGVERKGREQVSGQKEEDVGKEQEKIKVYDDTSLRQNDIF